MTTQHEVRCGCRKHAITGLRCSRCDTPICPDCSKPAPIGFFCRACAADRRSPLFDISAGRLAAAAVTGLTASLFAGWLLSSASFGFGFYGYVVGFFAGVGIGELILRVTNRKRGLKLEILAGAVVVIGIILGRIITLTSHGLDPSLVLSPMSLISIAVVAFGAVNRVRFF